MNDEHSKTRNDKILDALISMCQRLERLETKVDLLYQFTRLSAEMKETPCAADVDTILKDIKME